MPRFFLLFIFFLLLPKLLLSSGVIRTRQDASVENLCDNWNRFLSWKINQQYQSTEWLHYVMSFISRKTRTQQFSARWILNWAAWV